MWLPESLTSRAPVGGSSFLTITTAKPIHTLTNEVSNGFMNVPAEGHNEVGVALEAAGNSVLGVCVEVTPELAPESQPAVASQPPAGPTLTGRVRELADLHREGILSDDEFAAAKAKLLEGL